LQHVGRNWCHFFPDVVSSPPLSLVSFRTPSSWDIPRWRSIATRDIHSEEYWSADEISTESQWQNRCFLKSVSTAKARCSTDQRSMATEMLWVSLEERPKTNSPRQRSHSQLCYQIVRYFYLTLYKTYPGHIDKNKPQWTKLCKNWKKKDKDRDLQI
jgi:hypothetical protein